MTAPLPMRRGQRPSRGPSLDRYEPGRRCLPRLLEDRAAAMPDRPWLVFDGGAALTFGDAWSAARAVAATLGPGYAGRRAALMMPACPAFFAILHGVLLAGGVCALVDPGIGEAGLERVLAAGRFDHVFTDADGAARLPRQADGPRTVAVTDADLAAWRAGASRWDGALPDAAADALIMYTSGTTGRPKGVVLSHHFAFVYGALVTDALRRGEDDVLFGALPLFHASGLQMVALSALHAGCTAHLRRRFSVSGFWPDIAASGATQANLVPEMARMLLAGAGDVPPNRLRHACIGGMVAGRDAFGRRFGADVLWQGYGMTEAYPAPMALEPAGPDDATIGMPMDYLDYAVVDEAGDPVPDGVVGELVIRPRAPHWTFARYLDDAAATAHAFRGGVLHTGDLAMCDAAGVLAHRGRQGDRIRRRGEYVDAVEIEQQAIRHPHVAQAAVYGVPSPLGGEDVKIDFVATGPVEPAALREWLAGRLPRRSVPRYFERRDALPLTASGKVTKHALRDEGTGRAAVWDAEAGAPTMRDPAG